MSNLLKIIYYTEPLQTYEEILEIDDMAKLDNFTAKISRKSSTIDGCYAFEIYGRYITNHPVINECMTTQWGIICSRYDLGKIKRRMKRDKNASD
jgi:hypothetical protein